MPSPSTVCQEPAAGLRRCFSAYRRLRVAAAAGVCAAACSASIRSRSWATHERRARRAPRPAAPARAAPSTSRRSSSTRRGKPDSALSVGAVAGLGAQPQERRDGDDRHVEPGLGEVARVQLDDPAPLAVQVGLGEHAEDRRAAFQGAAQEVDLGRGQLLRRVGDEEGRAGRGRRGQGEVALRGVEAADARGVDEGQAGAEQPAVEADLDAARCGLALGGRPALGDIAPELVERYGYRGERAVLGRNLQGDRRRGAVAQQGRHGGDDVGVDRADVGPQQGVDQGALALLELTHDRDGDVAGAQAVGGAAQALGQVAATVLGGQAAHAVQLGEQIRGQPLPHHPSNGPGQRLRGRRPRGEARPAFCPRSPRRDR